MLPLLKVKKMSFTKLAIILLVMAEGVGIALHWLPFDGVFVGLDFLLVGVAFLVP